LFAREVNSSSLSESFTVLWHAPQGGMGRLAPVAEGATG